MTLTFYFQLYGFGLLGFIFQALLKARSIQAKARLSNVQFKFIEYFINDWISHAITLVSLLIAVLFVKEGTRIFPQLIDWIRIFFTVLGYSNGDIVSRFLSVTNDRVNKAIDHKTTIADNVNHTTEKPTPK